MTIITKYSIGNEVFLLEKNKVFKTTIIGITTKNGKDLFEDTKAVNKINYILDSKVIGEKMTREEFQIFLTKQDLLNSL